MSDVTTPPAAAQDEGSGNRAEIIAAVLLGIAGALTALAAYKAALLDGDALAEYSESTQELSDANQFYNQALLQVTSDRQLFLEYGLADTAGNVELRDYLRSTLMDENLQAAMDWWEADADALTPFDADEDNPYTSANQAAAEELEAQSLQSRQDGTDADEQGDRFELAAVLFALTLFFGGIATLLRRPSVTNALLGVGATTLVVGSVVLVASY